MNGGQSVDKPGLAFDPELDDAEGVKPGERLRDELARAFRWLVLYPAAAYLGLCLVIVTIRLIVPLFTADRLQHPVAVKAIGAKELILADGRHVSLRSLKRMPSDDPVFRLALKNGVEVDGRGEVFGLLTIWANCGVTLEPCHVTRINLRDLAASGNPDCVDESALNSEELSFLKEWNSRPDKIPGRLWGIPLISDCQKWHEAFERVSERSP